MRDFLNGLRKSPTNTSNIGLNIHQNTSKKNCVNTSKRLTNKLFKNTSKIHQQIRTTITQQILLKYIKNTSTYT